MLINIVTVCIKIGFLENSFEITTLKSNIIFFRFKTQVRFELKFLLKH